MASTAISKQQSSPPKPTATPHLPPPRTLTIKAPPHTYLHLTLLSSLSNPPEIDLLTARTLLTSALQQYLGLTGTAIPIDFLKLQGRDVWVRLPREDGAAVVGALSQWMGKDGVVSWRVRARGNWLGVAGAGDGLDLFRP